MAKVKIGGVKLPPFLRFPDPTTNAVFAFVEGEPIRVSWRERGDMESGDVYYDIESARKAGLDIFRDRADIFPVYVLSEIPQGKDGTGKNLDPARPGEIRCLSVRGTLYMELRKNDLDTSIPISLNRRGTGKRTKYEVKPTEWPKGHSEETASEAWEETDFMSAE